MESSVTTAKPQPLQGHIGGGTIFLALVTTFNVLLNVLLRWSKYDWEGRFLSLTLLFSLTMVFFHIFMQKKGKRKLAPDSMFQLLYMCVLMATLAFNRGLH